MGAEFMALERLGTATFASEAAQVAAARRWVLEAVGRAHPAADDCVLLVSEVFTNALRYGAGDSIEVGAFADAQAVRVEVVDGGGDTLPHLVDDPCGENGRGLPIIRALAADWGCERLGDGRLCVWFVVEAN
ncbi:ATP-binding protein [Actinomadura gamaensis]|uniref:ATP-binding protein n=1 Tax=Actinomadura gamaensis TaxID=1763541 RepID=A0ABV9TSL3_9ACTN